LKNYSTKKGDLAKMRLRKSPAKSIPIETSREIVALTKELGISLDLESVRKVISLGMESLNQEAELECALKKLEEEKGRIASNFRKIAFQYSQLEAKCVGTRNWFGRVSRDNRVLAMHLCARVPRGKREEQLRDDLIQKYIMNWRSAQNQQDNKGDTNEIGLE
jgi:hypothetical protein